MYANLVAAKTGSVNLTWFYLYLFRIFCTLLISFTFGVLLQSICFRMFYSKHFIPFEKCVDIFYIEIRFSETFTVMNSVIRILIIETLYKLRTIKY